MADPANRQATKTYGPVTIQPGDWKALQAVLLQLRRDLDTAKAEIARLTKEVASLGGRTP